MKDFAPSEIIVEAGSEASPIYRNLKRALPQVPFAYVSDIDSAHFAGRDAFGEGKQRLLLTRHKGDFLKKCPGSDG